MVAVLFGEPGVLDFEPGLRVALAQELDHKLISDKYAAVPRQGPPALRLRPSPLHQKRAASTLPPQNNPSDVRLIPQNPAILDPPAPPTRGAAP